MIVISRFRLILFTGISLLLSMPFIQAGAQTSNGQKPKLAPGTIIPAHPDAKGGGNPFQGIGRTDDPDPARHHEYWHGYSKEKSGGSAQGSDTNNAQPSVDSKSASSNSGENGKKAAQAPEQAKDKAPEEAKDKKQATRQQSGETAPASDKASEDNTSDTRASKKKDQKEAPSSRQSQTAAPATTKETKTLVPPPPGLKQQDSSRLERAILYINHKQYERAEELLTGILAQGADNHQARYLLAVTYVLQKRNDRAREAYRYIIKKGSTSNPGLVEKAKKGLNHLNGG